MKFRIVPTKKYGQYAIQFLKHDSDGSPSWRSIGRISAPSPVKDDRALVDAAKELINHQTQQPIIFDA